MDYYGWKPYVPVATRRRQAMREMAKLAKKGRHASPVVVDGRAIAKSFWGEAWCDNLERYSDFANRLPRGRAYVRNGSVVDLQIVPGKIAALVSGSTIYDVRVTIAAVPKPRWTAICRDCAGGIDSLVELLQGRFSKGVMARICQETTGLFPSPKEITFTCSCPDWASMCKHVAAVLYGIGARLDERPELLFTLRHVDHQDLIAKAGAGLPRKRIGPAAAKVLAREDLSDMFGIEIAPPAKSTRAIAAKRPVERAPSTSTESPAVEPGMPTVKRTKKPAAESSSGVAKRRAISERMRAYWAARRTTVKKEAQTPSKGSTRK